MAKFSKDQLYEKIRQSPIVPLFTHSDAAFAKKTVAACYEGGVRVFEYTNRAASAASVFSELVPFIRENLPDMAIGIGTIYNGEQASYFADLGCDFIIQPVIDAGVAAVCIENNMAWIPGAMTLTEIYTARQLGADIIKIFPANIVGPAFIQAIRGPMPDVKVMATGGVEPNGANLHSWFSAGAHCVGMGSQLFGAPEARQGDGAGLAILVRKCLEEVKAFI